MTLTHVILAVVAAVIVFVVVRGFGGSKINENDHTTERPRLATVDDALEQKIVNSLHTLVKSMRSRTFAKRRDGV